MAFLICGGVTVAVARNSVPTRAVEEIGDRERAFSGEMRSTVRARKKRWSVQTRPLTQADWNTLEAALNGTLPVACSGDLTGSVDTHPQITAVEYVAIAGGYRVVASFELHEA